MQASFLTGILLYLLLQLHAAVLAAPGGPSSELTARQDNSTLPQCQNYATIANLSTIGMNSTYRAAFLQSSSAGTYASAAILNNAMAQIPMMTNDKGLNEQCGNLTTVATTQAAANFTKGIVAQFSGLPPPSKGIPNSMVILFLGIVYVIFMGVLFHSL